VAVFPIFLGRLSETLPKQLLVVLGCLLGAALNLSMLFLHQYLLLITAALITGVGSALLMPALGTIYLNATGDENRAQIMGIRTTSLSFAMFIAPLTQAAAGPWITPSITFAISGAISIVMTIFTAIALRNKQ